MTPLSSARTLSFSDLPLILTILAVAAGITTGCGSSSSSSTTPPFRVNTNVAVLLSSTANARLTEYDLDFQSITLTDKAGATATLLSTTQPSEFIHLNGGIEPLVIASVPQDTYTSASITLDGAQFICVEQIPSQNALGINEISTGINPPVTVNLPSPITITGDSMALSLDMQVAQSASFSDCFGQGATYALTPTFNLAPITVASQPTNSSNGKVTGLEAAIASTGTAGTSLTLSVTAGPFGNRTLYASTTSATVFQGISGFSALAVGMFVNMDGAIQPDGSLVATRIEVENPSAVNIWTGPLLWVGSQYSDLLLYGRQEEGPLLVDPTTGTSGLYMNAPSFYDSTATFGISGQLTNLQTLPFVASFTAQNMVPGQNVDITSPDFVLGGGAYTFANTITLIPQTIDGTIETSTTSGNFTVYTVSLADYDLFPNLAVQPGQNTLLTDPSEMDIYVDSSTQMVNSQSLTAGNTLRFYGLVFNNSGTLSMDCAQVNEGVPFVPQSNASSQLRPGQTQTVRRQGPGGLPVVNTVVTRSR